MSVEAQPAPIAELRAVTTGYDDMPVIHGVDLTILRGRVTAIIGPNGAGKSTVLKALMGLLRPWSGSILVNGQDVTSQPAHRRVSIGVAYVPQGRITLPEMTVIENLEIGGFTIRNDRKRVARAIETAIGLFPILGQRRSQLAGTMSGGEQQMLAIARALMTQPQLILLDEPSLGLSPKFVEIIFDRMAQLKADGYTIAMVEQKATRALALADFGVVLTTGRNAFAGTGAELLADRRVRQLYLGEEVDPEPDAPPAGERAMEALRP